MKHFLFPGKIDFAAVCFSIVCETTFTIGESPAISRANWHRKASTTSGWKSSPAKIFHWNSSGERRPKFIASGSKKTNAKQREHRLAYRRQRRQHSDHKHVQRHRQNTTLLHCKPDWLQAKPTKRENTDFGRFKKRRGDQATFEVYSQIILSIISRLFMVK